MALAMLRPISLLIIITVIVMVHNEQQMAASIRNLSLLWYSDACVKDE